MFPKTSRERSPLVLHTVGVSSFPLSVERKEENLKGSVSEIKGSSAEMTVYITRSESQIDPERDCYLVKPAELIMELLLREKSTHLFDVAQISK